jgi:hypothetical protein
VVTSSRKQRPSADWIGRQAIWTAKTRRAQVSVLVRIVDGTERFGRWDFLVETHGLHGDAARTWVSDAVLKLVPVQTDEA